MKDLLNRSFLNNSFKDYLIAITILILGFIVIAIAKKIVLQKIKKAAGRTATTIDDFIVKAIEKTAIPLCYIIVVYSSLTYLDLAAKVESVLHNAMIVIITYYVLHLITMIIEYGLVSYLNRSRYADSRKKEIKGMLIIINIILWSVAVVFLLDNFGYNVTTVITGLGIGGVAIALASQNILSDLFCYFVIFFDRPFEVGDFITVDDKAGAISHIGIKTTRIKSISGEEIVFSNKDLTDSRVHNFKKMQKRRVVFQLDIVYETAVETLEQIPGLLKSVIENIEGTTFDRAHFASYGASSLKYEAVYYIASGDYNQYMDTQQAINFSIFRNFSKKNIQFAYPTQTVFMANAN